MILHARSTLATLAVLLSTAALAQAPVLQISGANFRPLPLAVTAPQVGGGASAQAAELDDALMFDLSAAGIFQVLDRKGFLADPKEGLDPASIRFSRWSDVGAEALVKTRLSADGGQLHGELHLYTVGTGKEELKVERTVSPAAVRRMAHAFADALFRFFTHEPGPFQTRIAFARKSAQGKDIWMADWDGYNPVQVTNGGLNLLPTVTPDGQGVAYTSYRKGRPEIYVQRPDGSPSPLVQSRQMATGIAYSRDGKRIAWSQAQGEGAQIWVANADGSNAHAITDTSYAINSSPSWAPEGKRIAFVSTRGGSPQLYVMTDEGQDVRRLTFQGNYNQTPDWSPRGDLIAFTARDERNAFDVFTVNVDTGKITRITQGQGNNEEPSFSPNGRELIFTSTRDGAPRLYVSTADGNTQLPLPLPEKGSFLTPAWGPAPREQ